MTSDQYRKARTYGDHAFVSKILTKVKNTLSKEEYNKRATVLPCWLELFFLGMCLTIHGLICKKRQERLPSLRQLFLGGALLYLRQQIRPYKGGNRTL